MDKMKLCVLVALSLIALSAQVKPAFALSYEDKPYFKAYIYGSNHVTRGDNHLTLILIDSAILRKVVYDDYQQYLFLRNRSDILTTAYNVSVNFTGCKGITVKNGNFYYPALPALKPVQIPLNIKVGEIKEGNYTIYANVYYKVVRDVFISYSEYKPPASQITKEIYYNYNGYPSPTTLNSTTVVNETVYPTPWISWMEIYYTEKHQKIPIHIVVEKENVKLKILKVSSKGFITQGKGILKLTIENVGEKTANDLFVMLSTPSGFSAYGGMRNVPNPAFQKFMGFLSKYQSLSQSLSAISLSSSSGLISKLSIPPQVSSAVSSSAYVGTLKPKQKANVTFVVNVNVENRGYYPFQITGVYTDEYGNTQRTPPVSFGVWVGNGTQVSVVSVNSSVYAGSKGVVNVTLYISKPAKAARVTLSVQPPLSAISGSYYLGDLKGNCTKVAKFRIQATSDAEAAIYPAKLVFTYKVNDKDVSKTVDIGIPVHKRMSFQVIGVGVVPAGGESLVKVEIKNTGSYTIREATARITVVDPFTTTDDTAYIGTLKPGQKANVTFKLSASSDATPKLYALNLEVKYKDPLGDWVISEPVKMPVRVVKAHKFPVLTGAFIAVLIAAIAYALIKRGK